MPLLAFDLYAFWWKALETRLISIELNPLKVFVVVIVVIEAANL